MPAVHEAEEDAYFGANPPPRHLDEHRAQAAAFLAAHAAAHRRVVLITSGGTTVPLERQTVRFIDNFSAGTRGAASAEHFLRAGYAVLFLHRDFSLLPFARHFGARLLDRLRVDAEGRVVAEDAALAAQLKEYQAVREEGRLLLLPFVTIGDYLHELRAVARLMRPLGPRGLLYLAAAVSDFFVPPERMVEHKIQSTDTAEPAARQARSGGEAAEEEFDNFDVSPRVPLSKRLVIDLDPVPKFLKNLVDGWAPQGMIVSYKLETDPAILVLKARALLARYQHHLVIGNLLATRKWEVVFVSPGRPDRWLRVPRAGGWAEAEARPLHGGELLAKEPDVELEGLIIPAVAELHGEHIRRQGGAVG